MLWWWVFLTIETRILNPCTEEDGSYVMNFMVHLNISAQLLITTYMSTSTGQIGSMQESVETYFNNIFSAVNRTLELYKVQVVGDFSQINFEALPLGLTPDKICQTSNAAATISTSALINLSWPKTSGMGNRIIIYNCIVGPPVQNPSSITQVGDCGNLAVLHIFQPKEVIKSITDIVVGSISKNSNKTNGVTSSSFVDNLCKYSTSCAVNNDLIGKFVEGLVNIKKDPVDRIYEIEGSRRQTV